MAKSFEAEVARAFRFLVSEYGLVGPGGALVGVTSSGAVGVAGGGGLVAVAGGGGPAPVTGGGGPVGVAGGGPVAVTGGGPVAARGSGPVAVTGGGPVAARGGGPVAVTGGGPVAVSYAGDTLSYEILFDSASRAVTTSVAKDLGAVRLTADLPALVLSAALGMPDHVRCGARTLTELRATILAHANYVRRLQPYLTPLNVLPLMRAAHAREERLTSDATP